MKSRARPPEDEIIPDSEEERINERVLKVVVTRTYS